MLPHTSFSEPQLVELRVTAQRLADSRRERMTSAHLLAAMVELDTPAARLLTDRRLTLDVLLKAARSAIDDEPDPLRSAIQGAREVARVMRASEPTALHLLAALLKTRYSAAFRALELCGVNVHNLRSAAMRQGLAEVDRERAAFASAQTPSNMTQLGAVQPSQLRQAPVGPSGAAQMAPVSREASTSPRRPRGKAVTVPLMKPVRPAAATRKTAELVADPSVGAHTRTGSPAHEREGAADKPKPRRPIKNTAKNTVKKNRFALDAKRFKWLNGLGRNLCLAAERDELEPVVGREREVEALLDVLAKREANNPCLVGVAGVGKTSVVHALALRIASSPQMVADERVIIEVSVSQLLSGTQVRGALSQRFGELLEEISALQGKVVLFFDDMQQVFGSEATVELMNEFKRALTQGEVRCLATCLPHEFQRVMDQDPSLERHFSRVDVEEPDLADACDVLEARAQRFSEHHGVQFQPEALTYAVAWSARYVSGRALPDKALSIVDLAGARASRRSVSSVGPEQVAQVVSELSAVPVERLLESDGQRMLRLEQSLAERVVGHSEQLATISSILRRNAAGLGGNRPIGTFLLLGPTGVGKTETAKAIAHTLFGSEHAMTRLDLSEYSESHAVARLVGAPPGYVGYEAGGQLTEAVRRRPYQVLLLDEIEKAHEEVLETFLPLFDEGRLTDGRGRTVDFTNTVILLTSNIGAREATQTSSTRVGFGRRDVTEAPTQRVVDAARARLSPEFFNRIDEVLVFAQLGEAEVEEIARRLLQRLADSVYEQRDVELCIEPSVVALLLENGGFEAALGARPMRRAIARLVEAPLADALLSGTLSRGDRVRVCVVDGAVQFLSAADPVAAAE